jgi:long-subunit fatty acid transport protein
MMTKKLVTIATAISLVFTVGIAAMAKGTDKTAYLEYENQSNVDNFGPTVGLDWNVNDRWTASASYQLEGDGQNEATFSVGADYAINKNLSAGLKYETADSLDSTELKLDGKYALQGPWTLTGGISYTDYSTDYEELELTVGTEYQVNKDLTAGIGLVMNDPSNGDSDEYVVIDAAYAMDEYGVYCKYETPDAGNKITVGASYEF